jgi:hypothetical protein
MSLDDGGVFVVLRWPADAGLPRYSFATVVHATELHMPVERVQTCATIEAAAALVARLNDAHEREAAA